MGSVFVGRQEGGAGMSESIREKQGSKLIPFFYLLYLF